MRLRFYVFALVFSLGWSGSFYEVQAQPTRLSPNAQISLITGGAGLEEIYTIFGHSIIRVHDPATRLDLFFNFGTFNFDTPNFLGKFIRRKLLYTLSVSSNSLPRLKAYYEQNNRNLYEQVLDLSNEERQKLFRLLLENYEEENRYYLYDFFYDNCSTRIREVLKKTLGNRLQYNENLPSQPTTFKDRLDPYLKDPWTDFGIYLILGAPADRRLDHLTYMFLPVSLMEGFDQAQLVSPSGKKPLVKQKITLTESLADQKVSYLVSPTLLMAVISLLIVLFTFLGHRRGALWRGVDMAIFFVLGLIGIFFLFMWLGTDHIAVEANYNMLWAFPPHFFIAFLLIFDRWVYRLRYYFLVYAIILVLQLVFWLFLPQELHPALIPFLLALAIRSAYVYYFLGKTSQVSTSGAISK